jgi:hypothetical protein
VEAGGAVVDVEADDVVVVVRGLRGFVVVVVRAERDDPPLSQAATPAPRSAASAAAVRERAVRDIPPAWPTGDGPRRHCGARCNIVRRSTPT